MVFMVVSLRKYVTTTAPTGKPRSVERCAWGVERNGEETERNGEPKNI
jgi:hypothetical protein